MHKLNQQNIIISVTTISYVRIREPGCVYFVIDSQFANCKQRKMVWIERFLL